MPVFLAFIWEKVPSWFRWVATLVILIMWLPLYVRDTAIGFVQKQAVAAVESNNKDQKLVDQKQDEMINATHEDMQIIKNYILYKKLPEKK